MAQVDVDVGSVVRAAARDPEAWVELRVAEGVDPATADAALADAVADLNDVDTTREGAEWWEQGIFGQLVSVTARGAAVMVTVPEGTDLEGWLTAVAAGVEQRGVSGRLAASRGAQHPSWVLEQAPMPTAFLGWAFDRDAMTADYHRTSDWYVPDADTERICTALADWAHAGGDRVVAGGSFKVDLGTDAPVAGILAQGVAVQGRCSASWEHRRNRTCRHVALTPGGEGVVQESSLGWGWRERLDALRGAVTAAPDLVEFACVRTALPRSAWLQAPILLPYPHVEEVDVRYNRHLLDRWVPDAHGLQVLTDGHLERAHDLSDWLVTPLGHGRHLVEAHDLTPWYANDQHFADLAPWHAYGNPRVDLTPWYTIGQPHADLLARARADFGAMILTPEVIAANQLPPSPNPR